ncbi:MAG TPA: histidine kinase [Ilumatobacteraceae bacterium]|nr:histidine kinase [Ilumatobacteraceae bacterium]
MRSWSPQHPSVRRSFTSPIVVPALLLAVAVAELVTNRNIPHRAVAALCTPMMIVALSWRRRWALPVCGFVCGAFLAQTIAGVTVNAQFATLLTLGVSAFAVGRHAERAFAWWGIGIVLIMTVVSSTVSGSSAGDTGVAAIIFLSSWLAGVTLAGRAREATHLTTRAALLEAHANELAIAAVELERRRIARELHDVIAHAITVMVLQAAAAETVLAMAGDERAVDALRVVQHTGRQALVDMKHLLGILRSTGEATSSAPTLAPTPSLGDLDALLRQLEATGLPVTLSTDGDLAACPPSVASSAYHIVREALTNTLRHAGPTCAKVTVRCNPRVVDVEVLDDGRGPHDGAPGYGLLGMRERVAAFGGDFHAGVRPEGGYAVHARFPLANGEAP